MRLNSFSLAAIIFVLLFGGIGFSSAMNWWQTESTKTPVTYTEGEAAGQYNPADIRGSYTFGEVSDLFGVPLGDLQAAFRLPADVDPAAYPLKSVEAQFAGLPVEMGTGSVRLFVAFYKGLPYDLAGAEGTYLFPEAAEILKARGSMRPEQAGYLEAHTVQDAPDATQQPGAAEEASPTPAAAEHVSPDRKVTGKTTFQNLLDWGVPQGTIEAVLGGSLPPAQTLVKDYASQKGLEFSTLKNQLQAEVDKLGQ